MPAEAYYSLESGYHATQLAVSDREFRLMTGERARKLQPDVRPDEDIFEFGVGTGLNLAALEARRKVGSDIGAHLRAAVEERGIAFVPGPESLSDGSFDIVLSHHSLEHVPHPGETLRELWRILRPGGKLLLFVPFEKERRYRTFRHDEPNHHLYSWNVQTLANLTTASGFCVEACSCIATGYERFAVRIAARFAFGPWAYRSLLGAMRFVRKPEEIALYARKGNAP